MGDSPMCVKSRKRPKKISFFSLQEKLQKKLHVSSSYAKILGEKLFRTWEFPRSGSKAKDGERKRD